MVSTSAKSTDFLKNLSARGLNINSLLCRSSLFTRAKPLRWPPVTDEMSQQSAQLHVMAGMNIDGPWPEPDPSPRPHRGGGGGLFEETHEPLSDDEDPFFDPGTTISAPSGPTEDEALSLRHRNSPTPIYYIHC